MAYVVTESCTRCEDMDRVEVRPVECFYGGGDILVMHPDAGVECGVCEPGCPARTIEPNTQHAPKPWLAINLDFSGRWPNIAHEEDPLPDAKAWDGKAGERDLLDPAPGAS